jgi:GntR family transcriptional regulator, transcriptional repressor for pyruvate dehydrogenase complex
MKFELPRRSSLPEEIAARLLDLIRERELRPGDKLPPERELAAMIGVSRPILREALRALSIMKVVDIRQGSGTTITSLEPKQLVSHLEFVFSKDNVGFLELFEARRVLEVGYIPLAAARISAAQLDRLDQLLAELRHSLDDADRFSDVDIEFHNTICAAANNSLLIQFIQSTTSLGKASRERTGRERAVRELTLRDHQAIRDALQARDPKAAETAMAEHLDHVEEALKGTLRPDETEPMQAI